MCQIISKISECFLTYLIPPKWKICKLTASSLQTYAIMIGKIIGPLACVVSLLERPTSVYYYNYTFVFGICVFCYIILIIFICKSKYLRIKTISRILRKNESE